MYIRSVFTGTDKVSSSEGGGREGPRNSISDTPIDANIGDCVKEQILRMIAVRSFVLHSSVRRFLGSLSHLSHLMYLRQDGRREGRREPSHRHLNFNNGERIFIGLRRRLRADKNLVFRTDSDPPYVILSLGHHSRSAREEFSSTRDVIFYKCS